MDSIYVAEFIQTPWLMLSYILLYFFYSWIEGITTQTNATVRKKLWMQFYNQMGAVALGLRVFPLVVFFTI